MYQNLIESFDNLLTNSTCQNCHVPLKHFTLPKYATPHKTRMNNALQYVLLVNNIRRSPCFAMNCIHINMGAWIPDISCGLNTFNY